MRTGLHMAKRTDYLASVMCRASIGRHFREDKAACMDSLLRDK